MPHRLVVAAAAFLLLWLPQPSHPQCIEYEDQLDFAGEIFISGNGMQTMIADGGILYFTRYVEPNPDAGHTGYTVTDVIDVTDPSDAIKIGDFGRPGCDIPFCTAFSALSAGVRPRVRPRRRGSARRRRVRPRRHHVRRTPADGRRAGGDDDRGRVHLCRR